MNKYLKGLIFAVMALSPIYTLSAYAEDQELRAGPWYATPDNQQLDVVVELPDSIKSPPMGNNFKLIINGKDVTDASSVQSFQQSGNELAWLVCIESASALSKPFIQTTKNALLSLFKDRQSLQVALFTFGANLNKTLTFEKNTSPAALTHAIEELKPQDNNKIKLYQSLLAALDYYEQAAAAGNMPKRKRILVIAQGSNQGNSPSYRNVVDRAIALGIPIDAVAIKSAKKSHHTDAAHLDNLEMIAASTGGRFVSAIDEISLADALTKLHKFLTETQTVVATFRYKPDQKLKAERAEVVFQSPATTKYTASFDASNLSVPKAEEPPPEIQPVPPIPPPDIDWKWKLTGIFSIAGLLLYLFIRRRKPQPDQVQIGDEIEITISSTKSDSPPQKPNVDRKTVVGGQIQPQADIWLEGISGVVQGLKIHIDQPVFTIGAGADNDLVIANDDYVSSRHAIIRCENGNCYITDQNSRNGTFVNDVRIPNSAFALGFGNRIRIGSSVLEIMRS